MSVKMMPGTSPKSMGYLAFARKGDVLLGVHPEVITPGEKFGVEGTTYFAVRVRSAPTLGLFGEEDAAQKVVSFVKPPADLAVAWPKVVFEKVSPERASTTVGAFIRGSFNPKDPGAMETLLANIGEGKMVSKLAGYLFELAEPQYAIVTKAELRAWLQEFFAPSIAKAVEFVTQQKQVTEAFEATIGSFGMQSAQLKAIFEASEQATEAVPANDEPQD